MVDGKGTINKDFIIKKRKCSWEWDSVDDTHKTFNLTALNSMRPVKYDFYIKDKEEVQGFIGLAKVVTSTYFGIDLNYVRVTQSGVISVSFSGEDGDIALCVVNLKRLYSFFSGDYINKIEYQRG